MSFESSENILSANLKPDLDSNKLDLDSAKTSHLFSFETYCDFPKEKSPSRQRKERKTVLCHRNKIAKTSLLRKRPSLCQNKSKNEVFCKLKRKKSVVSQKVLFFFKVYF